MRTSFSLIIFAILGCGTPSKGPTTAPVGTIDDDPISREAFTNALVAEQGDAFFRRYVDRLLVARAAESAKIAISDEKVKAAVDKEAERTIKGSFGGQQKGFEAKLAEYGLSFEQWRINRHVSERHRLLAEGLLKSSPDEGAVKGLFERRYGKDGVRRRISHVLVSTNPKTARFYTSAQYGAEREALAARARTRLETLRGQLEKGANFATLAKAHSEGKGASDGGDLGADWTGLFGRPFEDAVQAADVGGVSQVLASKKGLHLAKVTGIRKGARYRGRIIFSSVVAHKGGTPEEKEAGALAKIKKARADVLAGKAFAEVAKAVSDDPVTQPRGGDLGEFAPGRLGSEADAVLESLPVKKLSPPIRTKTGFVLVYLEEREFRPNRDKKTVSHIFLATDFSGVKKRKLGGRLDGLAKAKAEGLLARLRNGEDFGKLARAESDDELTRLSGGSIPTYRPNLFGPGLDGVLAKLEQGRMAVAKTKRGYHVVRLDGVVRSDYAVVRPDLLRELSLKQISKPQVEALVKRLRAKAKIVKSLDAPTSTTP